MSVTPAFTEETTATIRKHRGNFRDNCERDFFGRFAANVQSSWGEELADAGVEIEWAIFAEPRN